MATAHVQSKDPIGALAALFGVWAAALLSAFVWNRGSDVGQIGNLLHALPGVPLFGVGIFESLAGVAVALTIGLSWFGTGALLLRLLPEIKTEIRSRVLGLAIATAAGAAVWSLVFFLLGIVGAYNTTAAVASVLIGVVLAIFALIKFRSTVGETHKKIFKSRSDLAILLLIAVPVALAFITSLAPPIAKDTLLYHFSVPKAFVANGGLVYVEGNIASYMSLGTEMHVVWAMLLGGTWGERAGEAAAGATIWLFFPILLGVVYGWARSMNIDRGWSLLAVLLTASVPTVFYVAGNGYVDLASTAFVTLSIFSMGHWWKTGGRVWLVLIAVFLGAALSTKLITLFVFAAFLLLVLWRSKLEKDLGGRALKTLAGGIAALLLAAAIAAPWYLRTWVETGSPLFPFYTSVWKGDAPGWDAARSSLVQEKDAQYGGIVKSPFDYLLTPVKLSVNSQPDLIENFDGVLGAGFLFGLAVLGLALWKFELPIEPKIAAVVAAILFLFWLFSSQQLRYLLPIFPALAVAVVIAARKISETTGGFHAVIKTSVVVLSIFGVLVSASWFLQAGPMRVAFGGEDRDGYLTRNIDYYPYYQWLNAETDVNAKVWLINMRRDSYHLERPYISDYLFEDWTLRKMIWESKSVQELKAKAVALGTQYVLVRHDFLFDYKISTIVDDKKPKAENEAKMEIARQFLLDKANTIRADERFSLVKVF